MKKLTQGATRLLVLALGLGLTSTGWATTNPVTGAPETYSNTFTGETAEWDSADHWDTGVRPFISGGSYSSALVSGKTASTATSIDGWNLQVGAYNGAAITWSTLGKIQGDTGMWLTVDDTSSITINGWGGGNLGQNGKTLSYYVANANGVTWTANLSSGTDQGLTMNYYSAGSGSVSYQALGRATHVIKQADAELSGTSQVASKTLVSFTSSSQTFTAAADIKVKDGSTVLETVGVTSIRQSGNNIVGTTSELTTSDAVGSCEIVQCTDGIVLYWVDGNPADLTPTVYKPSISVNFTTGTSLSTAADVGISEYAIPGTSWNNLIGNNGSLTTVTGVDSTGAASTITGAKVTISGTRGYWRYNDNSGATTLYNGYIDDRNNGSDTPTVVVEGIPYYSYKVVVYFSNDTDGVNFGYITVNGDKYKGDNGSTVTCEGTSSDKWGLSNHSAWTEGGNYLVTPTIFNEDGTLTLISHALSGCRAGVAAIQIVEVKPDVGEDDLIIEVSGDTTNTVSAAKTLTGTVYLTGSGTLTLDGSAKISAGTINIGPLVTLNINTDRLDATTFTGEGTVAYDNALPSTGKGWTESTWTGTVWIKNKTIEAFEGNDYGNAGSTIRFTGVTGYLQSNTYQQKGYVHTVPLELVDEGNTIAFTYNNGWGGNLVKINSLKGTGTLKTQGSGGGEHIYIVDGNSFTGVFNLTAKSVYVGGDAPAYSDTTGQSGKLEIRSGMSMTVPSGKTWTANGGFVVNGTLVDNGTLSSTASPAISGSGTVTFGGVPSPTGVAWWKNAAWTGTVEISGVTNLNGNDYVFNNLGNSGSTLKLTNCTGWLKPNYTCVPALEIGGTFNWSDGSSGLNNTFKVATLKGSGTISIPNQGAETAVWQITDNWSGFTGAVVGNNTAAKRVLVFGSTLPSSIVKGEIYVSEGATLNLDNESSVWWGVGMGFVVDGTVKASSRSKWGGGTYMTLGDTGVLEFVSTSNTDDQNTEMGNITGTGTLKFSSTAGWRAYPKTDTNMPATTLTIQTEVADSLILPTKNNGETVIGNLAGSKNLRSDWSATGNDGRILTVTQSKDTEWQGKFVANRLTQFNVVAPAEGTPGTLTLSGTQSLSTYDVKTIPMQVDGSVKLTGTWVGNTTVSGTFGGTGTVTGNLTFSDGATFKAFSTDSDGLSVSGAVTFPITDGESVTVDLTGVTLDPDGTTLITANSINSVSKLASTKGVLIQESNVLKAYPVASLTKADGSSVPYDSIDGAMVGAYQNPTYQYVTVYAASPTEVTLLLETTKLKVVGDSSLVTIVAMSAEYSYSAGSPVEGVTTYTLTANPTTYTWSHAGSSYAWSSQLNWRFGDNVQAERYPMAGDSVVFPDGAAVTLDANADCAAITVNGAVAIGGDYGLNVSGNVTGGTGTPVLSISSADLNLSALSSVSGVALVLADSTATVLATTGATLAAVPTTTVEDSYVKTTANVGATTYSVAAKTVVTVSVGANVSLTIDGNAVADGATLKFTPEDTFTYVATPATNYTATVTVTGGTDNDGTVTVGETAITVAATATLDTYTITIPSVANTTVSVSYTSGGEAQVATAAGAITVDAGTSLTATWTAASGYKITAGASQTINPVAAAETLAPPTVEAKGATVSGVTFDYGADFATARVTATVSGDATTYTLTVGTTDYPGVVNGSTVTFSGVATGHAAAYDSVSYEISATDGTSPVTVSGGSGSAVTADTASWFSHSSANSGAPVNGSWTTEVNLSTPTNVTDNTFAATAPSTSSRVVLEFNVCFSSTSDEDVSGEAQAAIKLAEVNSVTTFMVLTNRNNWAAVSAAGLEPNASETYKVVLTIDYISNTYRVAVEGNSLTTSAGVADFSLAANRSSVQNIDFAGSGILTSMKGDQLEGYMVKDGQNHYYATIEAATQAYNSANAPYTVLHNGTVPSGWKIVEGALIKVAKGLFFMAY